MHPFDFTMHKSQIGDRQSRIHPKVPGSSATYKTRSVSSALNERRRNYFNSASQSLKKKRARDKTRVRQQKDELLRLRDLWQHASATIQQQQQQIQQLKQNTRKLMENLNQMGSLTQSPKHYQPTSTATTFINHVLSRPDECKRLLGLISSQFRILLLRCQPSLTRTTQEGGTRTKGVNNPSNISDHHQLFVFLHWLRQ